MGRLLSLKVIIFRISVPFITFAIETSGAYGGIAILEDDRVVGEAAFSSRKTHSRRLLPLAKFLFQDMGLQFSDLDLVAVSQGPGSFTGLRIGMSVAKGLAYGLSIPVVGVPSLDALAYAVTACPGDYICPLIDARKGEVYCALYEVEQDYSQKRITDYLVLPPEDVAELVKGKRVWLLGSGADVCFELLAHKYGDKVRLTTKVLDRQLPSSVGLIGYRKFRQHKNGDSLSLLKPIYVRPSEAEINLKRKRLSGTV